MVVGYVALPFGILLASVGLSGLLASYSVEFWQRPASAAHSPVRR